MQLDGAIQGGPSTSRPRRRPLSVLVAILVISAMVALLVWAGAFARSGVGTADAGAGSSAIIHDDPWKVHSD